MAYKSQTVKDVQSFMQEARERHTYAKDLDAEDRKLAREDVLFAAALPVEGGGTTQWPKDAIDSRKAAKRPIMTENRLHTFIAQVVNDGRQNKPAIKITPLYDATKATAELYQGRIRHIEYESDADIAYDTAREHQVTCGRGFIRVDTRYRSPDSFEQEVRIERVSNQFAVLFGPSQQYDCSDAEYCFVDVDMTREAYEKEFGTDTEISHLSSFSSPENPAPEWIGVGEGGEKIRVSEYWCKRHNKRELVQMIEGTARFLDDLDEVDYGRIDRTIDPRIVDFVTMYRYYINGVEILKEKEFLAPEFGIVPQWGHETIVDGRRRTKGLIRHAQDPQRLINIYVSAIAEMTALAPKSPYIGPAEAFAGYEKFWENLNTETRAYLPYHQFDENGRDIQPPRRELGEPPIQALVIGYQQAVDALKASMGIYDPSLGARSNETSGIAIQRRQKEADNANFHFPDNEARTRRTVGRIILCLLEQLDSGRERSVPIRTEDGKTHSVQINTSSAYRDSRTNEVVQHQVGRGDYGVAVSTGPSYTSQRQEAFDTYSQLAQAYPPLMQFAGDIIFDNLDAPGSDRIAERMRKGVIPPQVQEQNPQSQVPPQFAQQYQQMAQEQQILSQTVQKQAQEIEAKKYEVDSKERIEANKLELERQKLMAEISLENEKIGLKASITELQEQMARLRHQVEIGQQAEQFQQQQQLAYHQMAADQQQAQADRDHQAQLAEQAQQAQMQQSQGQQDQPQQQQE